jgi:hypothetical protein
MTPFNPFKKICADDVRLKISKEGVTFSFGFNDKQEKEKTLAAGRIHRKITVGEGVWKLEGDKLSVVYAGSKIDDVEISFKEIAALFEEMVK